MKAVQVGILVALVFCAGLLFKIYRGQQAATPAPAAVSAQATTAAAPVAPAALPPAPPAPAAAVPPAAPDPPKPQVAQRKPSPARKAARKAPEMVAEIRPPAEPVPAAPAPPPAQEQPLPPPAPPPPPPILNPPSETETAPPPPRTPHTVTIASGTLIAVRLGETLTTDKNQAGDVFSGTLDKPVIVDGFVIAERGARVQGKVLESEKAGRVTGVSRLALQLIRMHTSDGQDVALPSERFAKEGPTSKGEDAKKVGVGAAIGAAIGAIAGGGKGAAIGAGAGGAAGAGTVAATRGKPTELPVETRITFRLLQPVSLTERLR